MDSLTLTHLPDTHDEQAQSLHISVQRTRPADTPNALHRLAFSIRPQWSGPPIGAAEEAALVARAAAHCPKAQHELTLLLTPLVQACAQKLVRKHPEASVEDLMGEGFAAMLHAVRTFDPQNGALFTTFTRFHILGAMKGWILQQRAIAGHSRSANWRRAYYAFLEARDTLHASLGFDPLDRLDTTDALAQQLDCSRAFVQQMHAYAQGNRADMRDVPPVTPPLAHSDGLRATLVALVLEACARGTPRQRAIMRTLAQHDPFDNPAPIVAHLAQVHQITTRRVRQIHQHLFDHIRDGLAKRGIRTTHDALDCT